MMCWEWHAFDQDAQVGAGKGRVGVVDDDDLAVRVQQEQSRLREGLVCLADVAWLWTWNSRSQCDAEGLDCDKAAHLNKPQL